MKIEKYVKPSSAGEAFRLLLEKSENRIIAGGAWLKLTDPDIPCAIDLSLLSLNLISETKTSVEIGAMATLHAIGTNAALQKLYGGILSEAAMKIMGIPIQNIATAGGTVMGKFGFSDLITPLLAMDARLVFFKHPEMPLAEFLELKENLRDILIKIVIPKKEAAGYFHKVAKTSLDFAVLNVAVAKIGKDYRIAVGARPGIAALALNAAKHLSYQEMVTGEAIEETAKMAAKELVFGTNQRASAEYREALAKVYVERGLKAVTPHES
jgi:CO/xanthine dehydrogenase FAD-binding subunit